MRSHPNTLLRQRRAWMMARLSEFGFAAVVVAIAMLLAFAVERLLPHANLSLLFLTGVLIVAARSGLRASLAASVLSFLAFAFFFTPPYRSLGVAAESHAATLAFFLVMAAMTGHLAARVHREMASSQASLSRISKLYEFGRRISAAADVEEILSALSDHLGRSVPCPVFVLIPQGEGPPVRCAGAGPNSGPSAAEIAAAWAKPTRQASHGDAWRFLPLRTNRGDLGLVAVEAACVDAQQLELATSLCDQAALALDRVRLAADVERAAVAAEVALVRAALLSSVSHDLRTPLAAIVGSATSLQEYGGSIAPADGRELLANVVEEALRLDRYIQNLLDMTRLGQGKLTLCRDWVELQDLVASAIRRLPSETAGREIRIRIAGGLPLLWVQGVLIEQVLVNLLDNAVKFSPAGGAIEIAAHQIPDGGVEIEICDEGVGIPRAEREKVFDMFYSARAGGRGDPGGTGLGLAICRGLIAAHGGQISACDGRQTRGICMRIRLPEAKPGDPSEDA